MAKRDYFQELTDIYRDVVNDLNNLIKDEVDVSEKYIYGIATDPEVDEVKINKVSRNKDGNLILECRSLSSDEDYEYQLDQINTEGLASLLENILVDDCEPE